MGEAPHNRQSASVAPNPFGIEIIGSVAGWAGLQELIHTQRTGNAVLLEPMVSTIAFCAAFPRASEKSPRPKVVANRKVSALV